MKIFPLNYKISGIKIEVPFSAICSITDKSFYGFILVEYQPDKKILEYMSLEQEITSITKKSITTEDLAKTIFDEIIKITNPKKLKVLVDVRKSKAHQPVQVWIEN